MGDVQESQSVVLFLAVFSRYDAALDWARQCTMAAWGPIALESEPFAFQETRFYEKTMGTDLKKVLIAYETLVDPACLPQLKLQTNQWEQQYAQQHYVAGAASGESGSRLLDGSKADSGFHQGSGSSDLLGEWHLRGKYPILSRRCLAAATVDLSRLPAGGLSSILDALP